jgi:alpha-galactosidase
MATIRSVAFVGSVLLASMFSVLLPSRAAHALANGQAMVPPMGWNSWNKFQCGITDTIVKQAADDMVSSGMKAAGYQYIVIDDCWQQKTRDTSGNIQVDPNFSKDMPGLVSYVHNAQHGLKFGLYSDRGDFTCQLRAGSYGHEVQDAAQYLKWGVDYVKYDNCNPASGSDQKTDYEHMRDALKNTGRPITFSICAWEFKDWMPDTGNLWRTTGDIGPTFDSMLSIIDTNSKLARVAGQGAWNDPDMLEIGNGMSETEDRAQFSMWAMMAAPLIAGNDLHNMSSSVKTTLTNSDVIAIDQDVAASQGIIIRDDGDTQVWSKRLNQSGTRAIALFNRGGSSASIGVNWNEADLDSGSYTVRDLWSHTNTSNQSSWTATVPSHGVNMIKVSGGYEGTKLYGSNVVITNTDTRSITDLSVTVDFQINGSAHSDNESAGNFDKSLIMDLDGWRGNWDGSRYTGDFLYLRSARGGAKTVTIHKVDGRAVTNLRVSVNFKINGSPHYDYEDVGNLSGLTNLVLNGNGGTWDGSKWVGDFLHH